MENKEKIKELEDELYNYNRVYVSLFWIAKQQKPKENEILYLNSLLGRTIKLLREIRGEE